MRALVSAGLTAGLVAVSSTAAFAHPASYEVQPRDTLASIAAEFDEVPHWRAIDVVNQLDDPNLIVPGQVLKLPGRQSTDAAPSEPTRSTNSGASTTTASNPPANPESHTHSTNHSHSTSNAPASSNAGVWDRVAECESGGDWQINTGNGYYGGVQFALGSWRAVGGSGYPHQASKQEQIKRAELLLDRQGWGAWPACSSKLGLG